MVIVPLNQRHTDAELRYALEDSGTKVLFAGRAVGALLADVVEHVIDLGDAYEELLDGAAPADFPDRRRPRTTSPGSSTPAARRARRRA